MKDVVKKCLFIAPIEAHASIGRLAALVATGYEIHVIDVSSNDLRFELNIYPYNKISSYVKMRSNDGDTTGSHPIFSNIVARLRSLGFIAQPSEIINFLSKEIERIRPSIVVTYYGPVGIHFARLIVKINSSLPIISILNLIPSTLNYRQNLAGKFLRVTNPELLNYKSTLKSIGHIVCASPEMSDYVSSEYVIPKTKISILPDYFPASMAVRNSVCILKQRQPRLIFLGAPERWGGGLDDIDKQLYDIANSGIVIHSGKLSDDVISTNNGFTYPFLSDIDVFNGKLSQLAHDFDAALITYGINARHQRFTTTYPTRFFSAISAGIPIVVKSGLYDSVESYISEHAIGFAYSTVDDLKCKLSDVSQMKIFRTNSINHSRTFNSEMQADEFISIFNLLTTK